MLYMRIEIYKIGWGTFSWEGGTILDKAYQLFLLYFCWWYKFG